MVGESTNLAQLIAVVKCTNPLPCPKFTPPESGIVRNGRRKNESLETLADDVSVSIMSSPLLPERHPVRDFFVLDVLDVTPRSDIASMAHPIFSLSTKPETRILRYQQDDTIVEIHPSTKGLATIYDKDVLIYCISKLMHRKNNGEAIGPIMRISSAASYRPRSPIISDWRGISMHSLR